ncbi:MAG: serine--tRNA ligase [Proteobacteria bacterium]|nr:serine--tRNA ligase [Pseudomonadota bacterium]MBI3498895.1 serine--tRNA ligase [Pseudomonadota bacterium]
MIDLKAVRDDPAGFDGACMRRGLEPQSARILELDQRRRQVQTELQGLQARRNEASKEVGRLKREGGDADALMAEVARLKERVPELEAADKVLAAELEGILESLPNLPAADVPDGKDESQNRELRRIGEPKRRNFKAQEHFELGEALGLMDFEAAAKLSGARFVVLKGAFARMERALAAFMLDIHTSEFGYQEIQPPLLVRDHVLYGTGQLPKFAEDQFRTTDGYWLIPTAEVPLTNLAADSILEEGELPRRFTAFTPCFRSEAGAAGKDTRGMLRQHQFNKVELVSIAHPDRSEAEHERMTNAAETVLQRLELPYRVVVLCTGDMGFAARKTYDIEVWLPGQERFREISSCSNCGDFQARRMKARFRPTGEKQTRLVHTLNGSGLAIGRTLIAILENYQREDGSIEIPKALRPYLGGLEAIKARG